MPSRGFYISAGIIAGLVGAALVAAGADALSNALAGAGQEVFNATILGIVVIMLGWHNVWVARRGRQISENARQIGRDIATGARSMTALTVVVALTTLREGSEVVLFLYGLVISSREAGTGLLLGGCSGFWPGLRSAR